MPRAVTAVVADQLRRVSAQFMKPYLGKGRLEQLPRRIVTEACNKRIQVSDPYKYVHCSGRGAELAELAEAIVM